MNNELINMFFLILVFIIIFLFFKDIKYSQIKDLLKHY